MTIHSAASTLGDRRTGARRTAARRTAARRQADSGTNTPDADAALTGLRAGKDLAHSLSPYPVVMDRGVPLPF